MPEMSCAFVVKTDSGTEVQFQFFHVKVTIQEIWGNISIQIINLADKLFVLSPRNTGRGRYATNGSNQSNFGYDGTIQIT